MAQKHDKTPLERVEKLLVELAEAKLRSADAYTDARMQDKVSADDARHRATWMMASGGPKYRARDPEIIRVELAIALKAIGVDYPVPES